MARRRGTRAFVRPPPRTKMWIGAGVGAQTVTGGAAFLSSSLSAGALALRPFTILRTRILLTFETDQEAADERPQASYGKIVVTDAASAIGVTAVPNPSGISGNPEADWFVWQAMFVGVRLASPIGFATPSNVSYTIDSKAMRKVGPSDDIVTIVDAENSDTAIMSTNGRMLIQLH